MSPEEAREFGKRIMSELNLTPDMEDDLKKLIDSIDERRGEETREKDERIATLEKELAESKQRYIDRFFDGDTKEKVEEIKEEQKEDIEKDSEELDFDDLYEEREG